MHSYELARLCLEEILDRKLKVVMVLRDLHKNAIFAFQINEHINMKHTRKLIVAAFLIACIGAAAQTADIDTANYAYTSKEWRRMVRQMPDSFYTTTEAVRIAENVLAFQRFTGGWPKNVAMHRPLGGELSIVLGEKDKRDDSTTDNDATTTEMTFLARLYHHQPDERYLEALRNGVEFLLAGQYDNGGWPQFWPESRGYQVHITYNDDAMAQTLCLLRDIRDEKAPFDGLVDGDTKMRIDTAFNKGIECILNTQIVVDGQPTVWCQQHDHNTLKPAPARAYELASFCSAESAKLVEILMSIPNPDDRVIAAVEGAMKWFDEHKLTGIRVERFTGADGMADVRVVEDSTAAPIWARFYDLSTGKPLFSDRDGKPRKTFEEVGRERRVGYGWYSDAPRELMEEYKEWRNRF